MSTRRSKPQFAAGVIERHDNHILIAVTESDKDLDRLWMFPRGPVNSGESPEVAMRRIAQEQLGLAVEIVVGQPPVLVDWDERRVEFRYFFCGIVSGEAVLGPYAETRWVMRAHLREYNFDPASQQVVEWLLTEGGASGRA